MRNTAAHRLAGWLEPFHSTRVYGRVVSGHPHCSDLGGSWKRGHVGPDRGCLVVRDDPPPAAIWTDTETDS